MWTEIVDGKTVFRERITDPITGKIKNFSVRAKKETAQSRKEAQRKLFEKISDWSGKEPTEVLLSSLIDAHVAELTRTVRTSTMKRYKSTYHRILKLLGDVRVEYVTAGYIRDKLLQKKAVTANEYIKRLRTLFRWGYKTQRISSTAAVDMLEFFKEPPHRLKIQDKFLEASEAVHVIEALPEAWSLVAQFMILSGLRFGEVAGLDDSSVHDDHISVEQAYDVITHEIHETKTDTSFRDVPVNDDLRDLISRIRAHTAMRRKIYESDCPAFFLNDKGERIQIAAFNKVLKKACLDVVGRELTSHALRHTFASLLMENDIDKETIKRALGHKSSQITEQIYMHVTQELKRKDAAAISAVSLLKNGKKMGDFSKNQPQEPALVSSPKAL